MLRGMIRDFCYYVLCVKETLEKVPYTFSYLLYGSDHFIFFTKSVKITKRIMG